MSVPPVRPVLYPVSLDLTDRPCLVVGGGPVGARKAGGLLACGARVTVVAPDVGPAMEGLLGELDTVHVRPYERGEAARYRLVVTATGRPDVDAAVYADAEQAGVWVNSADDPAHCSFVLPAVHRDGAVSVAVSTGGASPALAAWLRSRLATASRGAGDLADVLGDARTRLVASGRSTESLGWTALLDGPLPDLVASGDLQAARAILDAALDELGPATRQGREAPPPP
jgi:siroheme synthase-like protein